MKKLIDSKELAEVMQVSIRTIYGWASKGIIPSIKIGRLLRFKVENVEAWIDKNTCKGRKKYMPEIIGY